MLKFQHLGALLIFAAVEAGLGGTGGSSYSPPYSPTPYSPPASAGYGYGGGYATSGAGYGTCGALKVTEVLDQIYCHHGYYTRFTSTDLAAIKVVLYELGLVTKFAHIQSVLEYVEQAIYFLQELKEETYKSYDTSELSKYYQNAGYDYSDLKGFIANETAAIDQFEGIRRGYRQKYGMITWGEFTTDPYASDYKPSKRSTRSTSQLSLYPTSPARRTRSDSEYDYAGDYTCAYISSSYCSANSIVVKNVLYRVLKATKSLTDALTILFDYISNHDCDRDNADKQKKYALLVTADTFGSVLCSASVLLEAAKYEYNIFTSMAGSSGYTNNVYGRSGGGSGGYSSAYQVFPYGYAYPGPYRYQRAVPLISAVPAPLIFG